MKRKRPDRLYDVALPLSLVAPKSAKSVPLELQGPIELVRVRFSNARSRLIVGWRFVIRTGRTLLAAFDTGRSVDGKRYGTYHDVAEAQATEAAFRVLYRTRQPLSARRHRPQIVSVVPLGVRFATDPSYPARIVPITIKAKPVHVRQLELSAKKAVMIRRRIQSASQEKSIR